MQSYENLLPVMNLQEINERLFYKEQEIREFLTKC
ncbi:hypothetical protein CY35_01G197600 [Sphagnum magellanicum]|nr:hypothetical protein CY35_01G197600 [Sphagnum magellanicum]